LFFVDHPILTPGVTALPRLAGTDSFTEWLFLEREFVQTDRSKTDPVGWLLLGRRLRQPSQSSQRISRNRLKSHGTRCPELQGSNTFLMAATPA